MNKATFKKIFIYCGFHAIYLRTTRIAPIEEDALNIEFDDDFQNFREKIVSGSVGLGPLREIFSDHGILTKHKNKLQPCSASHREQLQLCV